MDWLNWEFILGVFGGIVTIARVVTAITPNETDNKIVAGVEKWLQFLSLDRLGKNKPEERGIVIKTKF